LATTAINYTVETKEHFRYYTTPEYTVTIGNIVESLKLRRWPPATLKGTLSEYRFWFGYSNTFTRALNQFYDAIESLNEFIRKRIEIPRRELYNIIEFGVYDISGEDVDLIMQIAAAAKDRGASVVDMIPENLRSLLDCDVLVMLIDSSRISIDINDPGYKEMVRYDNLMAALISLVAMYRSKIYGASRAGKLYPVFVFTKFDAVDKKVLRFLGISDDMHSWFIKHSSKDRKLIHDKLIAFMKRFYEHSLAITYGGTIMGVELERAKPFVSYLMTEPHPEEGVPVPKVVKAPDGISFELVYSRDEYRRFIDYFGSIAGEIKKAHRLPEGVGQVTGLGR